MIKPTLAADIVVALADMPQPLDLTDADCAYSVWRAIKGAIDRKPSFEERLAAYRAMPGMKAYNQIADDWRAGVFDEQDAWAYRDAVFSSVKDA